MLESLGTAVIIPQNMDPILIQRLFLSFSLSLHVSLTRSSGRTDRRVARMVRDTTRASITPSRRDIRQEQSLSLEVADRGTPEVRLNGSGNQGLES